MKLGLTLALLGGTVTKMSILATATNTTTMLSRIRGAFHGALVSDALCLGSHYEYDAPTIKAAYGGKRIERYMSPGEMLGGSTHGVGWGRRNYHPGQKAGDQTDYGEYNILWLEYLSTQRKDKTSTAIDLQDFLPYWRDRLASNWGMWVCTQTKLSMDQYKQNVPTNRLGGNSNAMAIRSAAALAAFNTEEQVVGAARTMMFTHRSEEALSGGEFFARVSWKVIHQRITPREAMASTAKEMSPWIQEQYTKGFNKFIEATDPNLPLGKEEFVDDLAMTSMARLWDVGKTEPIKVGKASPTEGTLPSSVYIILKYENSYEDAVKANVMVGGDNASRAIAIGMVLGAYHGVEGIPADLLVGLNAYDKCDKLLRELPVVKALLSDEKEL